MKLIKLSEEHYVIVDEVKEIDPSSPSNGHWCYVLHKPSNTILEATLIGEQMGNMTVIDETLRNKREVLYKEVVPIIAASETMEFHPKESMKSIPLSEVEEAIFGYSVDKMAIDKFPYTDEGSLADCIDASKRRIWKDGFNAHKELVKDKLFTAEDMKNAFIKGKSYALSTHLGAKEIFHTFQKSLEPKTEWEVKFDEQGKLKLI